jgi:polyisoprenoid-binding protein YceI
MMVTYVRGHFKNVHGTLDFDPDSPTSSRVEATIEARELWTGDPARDAHLRSADFLDVERFPQITFRGRDIRLRGRNEAMVLGDLTIRGVDKGPRTRAGFLATTRINRHDFDVRWNSVLDQGGVVVGDEVAITIDAEAIRDT